MAIITDYSKFNYTKIKVPIYMIESPSDDRGERHFVNVNIDSHTQSKCYIGNRFIDSVKVERISVPNNNSAKWCVTIIVSDVLNKGEIFALLRQYCEIITKQCSIYVYCGSNGFRGFGFDQIDVLTSYSDDGITYIADNDFRIGMGEITTKITVMQNVFLLNQSKKKAILLQQIEDAYVAALKSGDMVSRYILLYRVIELIKGSKEMESYRADAEKMLISQGITKKEWQALAIYEFLRKEFGVSEYRDNITLTVDTLRQIIIVRNDMAHESDLTNVRRTLYDHFIPIVQAILLK